MIPRSRRSSGRRTSRLRGGARVARPRPLSAGVEQTEGTMRAKTLDYTDRDSERSWRPRTVRLIVLRLVTAVAFLLLAAPLATEGQLPEKIARIGMLRSEHRPLDDRTRQNIAALRAGLQDGGYAEGQHYRIDYHSPTSEADVVKLARSLVRDRVDVIHASAYTAIHAAQKVTTTIPIVAHDYETNPIAAGFVATLARPGGNITGMFLDLPEISESCWSCSRRRCQNSAGSGSSGIPSPGRRR